MAVALYNLARMYTNTRGQGTITLTSPVPPFLSFAQAGVPDGTQVGYSINDFVGNNVEIGLGTYTAADTTLTRDTVYRSSGSSNTGKIALSGQAEVAIDPAKEFFSSFIPAVGTIRLPADNANINILTTDTEVGIITTTTAVSAFLPTATAWAAANPNGIDLTLLDYTGNAASHNITPIVSGSDVFLGNSNPPATTPLVTSAYGLIRLRPIPGVGWYLR